MNRLFRLGRGAAWIATLAWGAGSTPAAAGSLPGARIALEVLEPGPGRVPEAAPWRFVLLEDRTVYVGGSDRVVSARLEKRDVGSLEKLADRVRKQRLGSEVRLGPGDVRYHLELNKGEFSVDAVGDPASPPAGLRELARLLDQAAGFLHPKLRAYRPESFLLRAVPGTLPGGCRRDWPFGAGLSGAAARTRLIAAAQVRDWPVGAYPASVCADGQRFVVSLRPLLPGEGAD